MSRTMVALVAALLTVSAAPAAAQGNYESLQHIAEEVERDRVYVSDPLQQLYSEEEARELAERIEDSDTDVYVVVAPWRTEPKSMLTGLANNVGRDGYYLAVGNDGRVLVGTQLGMGEAAVASLAAEVATERPDLAGGPLADRLDTAVDLLLEDGAAVTAHGRLHADPWYESAGVRWVSAAGPVLVLAALVVLGVRWWSRRPLRVVPLSETVRNTVDTAQREVKRDLLVERLTNVGERVAANGGGSERIRTALESYEAAARVLDSVDDMSDLVGVKVLLDRSEAALDGKFTPGHCFFDPRHPGNTADLRWRAPASFDSVTILACRTCRRAVRSHRTPESVTDASGPRPVPYYTVPPERSVWAATGYGTLAPDLAARILRGELRA